jgi:hypothetical protein
MGSMTSRLCTHRHRRSGESVAGPRGLHACARRACPKAYVPRARLAARNAGQLPTRRVHTLHMDDPKGDGFGRDVATVNVRGDAIVVI